MNIHIGAVLLLVLIIVILFSLLAYRLLNELDKQIEKNERHKTNVDNGYYLSVGEVGWSDCLGYYVKAVEGKHSDATCLKCVFNRGVQCSLPECQRQWREDGKDVYYVKHELICKKDLL